MTRDLFLPSKGHEVIEKAVTELADLYEMEADDVRRLIYVCIAPHPPVAQCKEAIQKVRRQLANIPEKHRPG